MKQLSFKTSIIRSTVPRFRSLFASYQYHHPSSLRKSLHNLSRYRPRTQKPHKLKVFYGLSNYGHNELNITQMMMIICWIIMIFLIKYSSYRYLLGPKAVTFTILRHPVDLFESLYAYANFQTILKLTLHEYIQM